MEAIGDVRVFPVEATEVVKGAGVVATVNGRRVAVGNAALMERENVKLSAEAEDDLARLEAQGNSLVLTAVDGELKLSLIHI